MKLSLHRVTTQRFDTHESIGLTFRDADDQFAVMPWDKPWRWI